MNHPGQNICLVAINAKYAHTNLAVRNLYHQISPPHDVQIIEKSINTSLDDLLESIVATHPICVAFSCYIWNIDIIIHLAHMIKSLRPQCMILLGGPEVSYDYRERMASDASIDMICVGPGEACFQGVVNALHGLASWEHVPGLCYRIGDEVKLNPSETMIQLDQLPFPYHDLPELSNRLVYFETSRGCPFDCAYCMSGNRETMMYLSMDRVRASFRQFIASNTHQVKLVDRTFNFPLSRAKNILHTLLDLYEEYPKSSTRFHFEINPIYIDEELIRLLQQFPTGRVQLEIGVQSTSGKTLEAIQRNQPIEEALANIHSITQLKNIKTYTDLIAGLPYESYDQFRNSFNDVYALQSDVIHLGFLKVLKGSQMALDAQRHDIVFDAQAPYQVLETPWISYEELRHLSHIEDVLDMYRNSRHFTYTLPYCIEHYETPFDFFDAFTQHLYQEAFFGLQHKFASLFDILYNFMASSNQIEHTSLLTDCLTLDWATKQKPRTYPHCIQPISEDMDRMRQRSRSFYNDPEMIESYLPHLRELTPSTISRLCHIVQLRHNITSSSYQDIATYYLFDYSPASTERCQVIGTLLLKVD